MVKTPASIPVEVGAYEQDGARGSWLQPKGLMSHINTLRTLVIGSALIFAIGTSACASHEEDGEKDESGTAEAMMPTETSEGTMDATSPAAEESESQETPEMKGAEAPETEAE